MTNNDASARFDPDPDDPRLSGPMDERTLRRLIAHAVGIKASQVKQVLEIWENEQILRFRSGGDFKFTLPGCFRIYPIKSEWKVTSSLHGHEPGTIRPINRLVADITRRTFSEMKRNQFGDIPFLPMKTPLRNLRERGHGSPSYLKG